MLIRGGVGLGNGGVGHQRPLRLLVSYFRVLPFYWWFTPYHKIFQSFFLFSPVSMMLEIPLTPPFFSCLHFFKFSQDFFMTSPLRKLQRSETCVFEIHWEIAPLYYTLVLKGKKWIYFEFPSFS